MLQHLSIKNFAIIKSTQVDFCQGMTVLTGETGAGKSILLDALAFVLGARLERNFLKEGEVTEVAAAFEIVDNQNVKSILSELFIDYDNECVIRRVVNKSGQSRIFINGSITKASDVKRISDNLINIYSQNSHQNLLDSKAQLDLLDSFMANYSLLENVSESFTQLQSINAQINKLKEIVESKKSQKELLEYKLEELLDIELQPNEFEKLTERHKKLTSVDDKLSSLNYISEMLHDSEQSILASMSALDKDAQKFTDGDFDNLQELITNSIVYLKESYDESRNILENIEPNPQELAMVEQRMSAIYDLSRKHKVEPEYLHKYISNVQLELENISEDSSELDKMLAQKQQLEKQYLKHSLELSKQRKISAKAFSKEVERNIRMLNIPKGSFKVEIESLEYKTIKGMDSCEFLINFNLGEDLAPVKKVASGGELSRIGLSIQAVSAEKRSYPTLVFDEVDVGISGATAEIVGKLLKNLSKRLQVLCITHQAQVAAQGDTHLHVMKKYLKSSTLSQIVELTQEQRVEEIAKIVGGVDISENTLKHAREMLEH